MSDQERLEIGQTFGRYQIVRMLGEGGMGVVYEALHLGLKKRFAVKTLLPAVAGIPEARVRFLREGEAASRIHHPHVVNVVDVGTEGGIPFLVMELLEGRSLEDLIASTGRLEIEPALGLLLPAISAVAAGHAQGVVHRDLKPANVFIARGPWGDSVTKVLDFGVSKLMAAGDRTGLTAAASVLGTAAYMSPEQAMGLKDVDGRSDQFALGQILYEMLTGAHAHSGENQLEILHNIASGNLQPPRKHRPDLPPALEDILLRMLALAPSGRYATLQQAGRALMPYADDKVRGNLANAFPDPPAETVVAIPVAPPTDAVPPEHVTTFQVSAGETTGNADRGARGNHRGKIIFAVVAGIGVAGSLILGFSRRSPRPGQTAAPVSVAPGVKAAPAAASGLSARPPEPPAPPSPITLQPVATPGAARHAKPGGTLRSAHPRSAGGAAPARASTGIPTRGPNDAFIIH